MSLTTSARCVKLFAKPSYYAKQANITVLVLVCSVAFLSDIPLLIALILMGIAVVLYRTYGFFPPAVSGTLSFSSASQYELNRQKHSIYKVIFTFAGFGLLMIRQDKSRVILWRDSLEEGEYRRLVVMLKREF